MSDVMPKDRAAEPGEPTELLEQIVRLEATVTRLREAVDALLAAYDRSGLTDLRWFVPYVEALRDAIEHSSVDPTLDTAADYETDIRPYIAELEATVTQLREELALRDDSLANRRVRLLKAEANRLREALAQIAAGEARPSHIAGQALDA